uniref:Uncharacterized protein n=1 Tax=Caenorhabditis japonica TaxID=281687 RepID=A0A8R1DKU9_CAEJA
MKYFTLFLCIFTLSNAYPASKKSSEQLELLVDQIYPEITTYLTRGQIKTLFQHLAEVVCKAETLEDIARAMSPTILSTLTDKQKTESWDSIQKAQRKFGGFKQFKVIFFHSLDAVQNFMGDSMDKDRVEVTANSNGKTEDETRSMIYEVFRQYFNVEFGQKVMDTVKYSMTEEDWEISIEDADKYMNIENFNMVY